MKATANRDTGFSPVELNITFQSIEEVQAFYAVFNAPVISRFFKQETGLDMSDEIREAIDDVCVETSASFDPGKAWSRLFQALRTFN